MSELSGLLEQQLLRLEEISVVLKDISLKLDRISGGVGVDDIAVEIQDAVSEVVGETRYNLTDIHAELNRMDDRLLDIDGKLHGIELNTTD